MLRGTRIITGAEALTYVETIDKLRATAMFAGFEEVIVPAIWEQSTFVEKAGEEVLGQMYTFKDKKDRDICLIPEVTAIIQEEYNKSWKAWKKPVKVFYVSKCYRYERPQAGRYREFTQFGVEVLGDNKKENYDDYLNTLAQLMVGRIVGNEYEFNNSVKRGLSYYTEAGFEIECPILGAQKQVLGGGRYAEGIGFAIGIDRLVLAKNLLDIPN
jgi:histidyl-tRNA synthetase